MERVPVQRRRVLPCQTRLQGNARLVHRGREVLTFHSDAWSRYDGITGYFFRQTGKEGLKAWDLPDDDDLETWRDLFELLPDAL